MSPKKRNAKPKASKTLRAKVNAYNKYNMATNKKLNAMRYEIIKRAKKEGLTVKS